MWICKLFLAIVCKPYHWSKFLNTRNRSFKMKFKGVSFRNLPFCSLMHSLCRNGNIPLWGKCISHHDNQNYFPHYPHHYLHHRNQIYKSCFPNNDYFLKYSHRYWEDISCGTVNNAVQGGWNPEVWPWWGYSVIYKATREKFPCINLRELSSST